MLGLGDDARARLKAMEVGALPIPKSVRNRLQELPSEIKFAPNKAQSPKFRFVDLFEGIGGIRLPFQFRGGECVFTAEYDKHAQITYAANFGDVPPKSGDITEFRAFEIPQHDLLLAGFPCQTFSQAGRGAGFHDTRGTMFFEIQRILAHHRPTAFLLENVKQLKGHDKGRTLATIMSVLRDKKVPKIPLGVDLSDEALASLAKPLDYIVGYRVLRARDFGVPQNRERIYIVGIQREVAGEDMSDDAIEKMFDRIVAKEYPKQRFGEILETDTSITDAFAISERLWAGHVKRKARHLANGNGFGYSLFDHESEYCNTISARYYKDGSEILVSRGEGQRPRKLTPIAPRSVKTGLKRSRGQRNMSVQRWVQLKSFWFPREVPKAEQRPFRAPLFGYDQFISTNMEGCSFPSIRRLHLYQSGATIWCKAGNIVASTVTFLLRNPPNCARKVVAAH